jgi:hypothetical protein
MLLREKNRVDGQKAASHQDSPLAASFLMSNPSRLRHFKCRAMRNKSRVRPEPSWAVRKRGAKDSLASGDYCTEVVVLLVVVVTLGSNIKYLAIFVYY